jgi:hypothetical protein
MKTKRIFNIFFLFLTLHLSSCSYFTVYYQTGSSIKPETSKENIQIYTGDIERNYQILGSVAVDVVGSAEEAALYLKKKAALIGADAIIYTVPTKMHSYVSRTGLSGVAVRFN